MKKDLIPNWDNAPASAKYLLKTSHGWFWSDCEDMPPRIDIGTSVSAEPVKVLSVISRPVNNFITVALVVRSGSKEFERYEIPGEYDFAYMKALLVSEGVLTVDKQGKFIGAKLFTIVEKEA